MTSMTYKFDGRTWELTDEASQSSYGQPVLVADDGRQLTAGETAIHAYNTDTGRLLGLQDEILTAYDIVLRGERNGGADIPSSEYPEFEAMFWVFARQCEAGRTHLATHEARF